MIRIWFCTIVVLFFHFTYIHAVSVSIAPVIYQADSNLLIELDFHYYGKSLTRDTIYAARTPQIRSSVEVTMFFKRNADIVKFDRYKLNLPVNKGKSEFLDSRIYSLDPGTYELEIEFVDHFDTTNVYVHRETMEIPSIDFSTAEMSGIKMLARLENFSGDSKDKGFVKHGVVMEPLPHRFYNSGINTLSYYVELYRLEKLPIEHYIVQTEISSRKKDSWKQELTTYQKIDQPSDVNPIAKNIDIAGLPSNTYKVSVRLIDAQKKVWLKNSAIFVHSNPYRDSIVREKLLSGELDNFFDTIEDERILYAVRALAMKLGGQEQETINNMIQKDDYSSMRDYLFRYWIKENSVQPQYAYRKFMRMIDAIDQKFYSGFRNGFETDRGMIFLRYGPPMRIITRENDQGAVPYEIWTYDRVDMYNQVDVKFVFYNPNIAGDEFQLLHSNARNEIRNPQWLTEIYNINDQYDGPNPVDARGVQDNYQREAARIFNDN